MPPTTPYDEIAELWDASRTDFRPKESAYLARFLHTIPPASTLLDLGCGTGRPFAAYLASLGHHVVGIDRSPKLLRHARRHLPHCQWIEGDITTIPLDSPFAGVICWDALFHIPRAHHRPILEKIHRCLLPGGRLMFTSGGSESDLPPFTDTMFNHEFFYDAYPKDQTIQLTRDAGFTIQLAELIDPADGGRNKGKLAIIASKRSPDHVSAP